MYLRTLPEIMAWDAPSPVLTDLRSRYVEMLATRLGEMLGRLAAVGRDDLVSSLAALLDDDGAIIAAYLVAPEVSYRLLWPSHHSDVDAARFLYRTLSEAMAPDGLAALSNPIRAASGPEVLGQDGAPITTWSRSRDLPVDVASPFALTIDVAGTALRLQQPSPGLSRAQVRESLTKLDEAVTRLSAAVEPAWAMVCDFTETVMLLPDFIAPNQFSSGSSGQFIGRVVLANPHLPQVTPVHLAEALVHEAIHGVLYMDEQHDPWVLDQDLYAGPMRVVSPWTGNLLPLRPFLQACFVWFGLLGFWSRALRESAFDRNQVRERLVVAAAGFLRGDLLQRVEAVADRLSPEVQDAVFDMQRLVVANLSEHAAVGLPK
jgi:hypothetical protein